MSAAALGLSAEEYAAGAIRRALDSACVPDLRAIADDSALTVREVTAIRDHILSGKREHRDLGRGVVPPPPTDSPDVDRIIAAALDRPEAKVRALAKRAHDARQRAAALVDDLRAAVVAAEEDAAERARRAKRIAKLEAELAALRPKSAPPRRMPTAQVECPLCGWVGVRLAQHEARRHRA